MLEFNCSYVGRDGRDKQTGIAQAETIEIAGLFRSPPLVYLFLIRVTKYPDSDFCARFCATQ